MKALSRALVSAVLLLFALTACNPHDTPPQQTLHAEYLLMPQSCLAIMICPNPGNNCSDVNATPVLAGSKIDMLNTFYRMYRHDSVNYFFRNYDWEATFPELNHNSDIVSKIMDGTYLVRLMGDSSIVIATDTTLNASNIVFAYNRDARANCD